MCGRMDACMYMYVCLHVSFHSSLVLFAGLKVIGVDAQPNLTSSRNKFVFITWSGSKVNAITKAKVSIQQQVVYGICNVRTPNKAVSMSGALRCAAQAKQRQRQGKGSCDRYSPTS